MRWPPIGLGASFAPVRVSGRGVGASRTWRFGGRGRDPGESGVFGARRGPGSALKRARNSSGSRAWVSAVGPSASDQMNSHTTSNGKKDEPDPPQGHGNDRRVADRQPQECNRNSRALEGNAFSLPVVPDVLSEPTIAKQPVVQLFGASRVAGRGQKQKRGGRKEGQEQAEHAQCHADRATCDQEDPCGKPHSDLSTGLGIVCLAPSPRRVIEPVGGRPLAGASGRVHGLDRRTLAPSPGPARLPYPRLEESTPCQVRANIGHLPYRRHVHTALARRSG